MAVNYTVRGNEFVAEKPRWWTPARLYYLGVTPVFDLAPDGKCVAAVMPADGGQPRAARSHVMLVPKVLD
jgi:hypothetical protein